jgi:monoamine oxidase
MHTGKIDTIIIGAGVSGNYAASILAEKGDSFVVLEARSRVDSKILTNIQ